MKKTVTLVGGLGGLRKEVRGLWFARFGRPSERPGKASDGAGRASEVAGKASEGAERFSEGAGWISEGAGRGLRGRGSEEERSSRKSIKWPLVSGSLCPTSFLAKGKLAKK